MNLELICIPYIHLIGPNISIEIGYLIVNKCVMHQHTEAPDLTGLHMIFKGLSMNSDKMPRNIEY